MDDDQLRKQAQKLDKVALQTLHQRYYPAVARYVQLKVGNRQTIEDLCSEVFIRVIEGLKRGQGWKDSPRGWIVGIARHVVADYYRKRERLTEVKLTETITANPKNSPTQYMARREQNEQLLAAIEQLTAEQQDVILMRFIEGMSIDDVAQALDKTPGAVKGLQYRASRALAELMASEPSQEKDDE